MDQFCKHQRFLKRMELLEKERMKKILKNRLQCWMIAVVWMRFATRFDKIYQVQPSCASLTSSIRTSWSER